MRKSLQFGLGLTAFLAALMMPLGCEPYARQAYQPQPYPPPSWGPQPLAPVPPGTLGTVSLQDVAARIWGYTNEARQQYGLPPLAQEAGLSASAQAYCADMLWRRFFSHTNPEGLTARERLRPFFAGPISGLGENIWEGVNLSLADREALARFIMNSWMSSPGHRENIIDPDFTHLGVAVAAQGRELRASQLFVKLQRH